MLNIVIWWWQSNITWNTSIRGSDEAIITAEGKTENEDSGDTENNDEAPKNEVKEFQNKQYVSGADAYWCFRENEIAERKPSANRLQIHLEGEQTVYFDPSNKDQSVERIEKSSRTKLIALFELNKFDKSAKNFYIVIFQSITRGTGKNMEKEKAKM